MLEISDLKNHLMRQLSRGIEHIREARVVSN